MNYELVRNANVEVTATANQKNFPVAVINVNDKYEYAFPSGSRVSKALETTTPQDVASRLTGGHFFFVEGDLVDFRDGNYNGFVHSDQSIDNLVDVIGIREGGEDRSYFSNQTTSKKYTLDKVWSNNTIIVPSYNEGGEFSSKLLFRWNPFFKDVSSKFSLARLICTNGMTGLASFLNTKIPLVNRWTEHLEIANRQIQNKVDSMVSDRFSNMGTERATVAEVMLIAHHAQSRLTNLGQVREEGVRECLRNIMNIAHPVVHLGKVYKSSVFEDKRIAAQLPAHLTTFDVYNMATEIRSHTPEAKSSSNHALDKFANHLVFDRKDVTPHASQYTLPQQSPFSDPDAAFFGTMH